MNLIRSSVTRREEGFTLVELLVTMMILSILMGLGAFGLTQYWRAQALSGSANQVLTDMRDSQVRAQAEVRTYRMEFDPGSDSYTISRLKEAPSTWEVLEVKELDEGIDLTLADFGADGTTASFFPRGTSSSGRVVLESERLNQDREISLKGLTARAELS